MHENVKEKMHIHAQKGVVSEAIKSYFVEKLSTFDTKEDPIVQALIDIEHHRIESMIKINLCYATSSNLAQGKGKDLYLAIDDAVHKIEKQRLKHKSPY